MEIKTKFNLGDRVYFYDGIMAKHGNVEEITIKVIAIRAQLESERQRVLKIGRKSESVANIRMRPGKRNSVLKFGE